MWKCVFCVYVIGCATAEKVIIVGSGPAGIAAASRLLEHNITDFRILEAQNRIGGRIHSFHLGNATVDLGAQYIHGQEGNLVYDLAKDYVKPGKVLENLWIYYRGHEKTGENLINITKEFEEDIASSEEFNVSLGDAFLTRYNATVLTKYNNDPDMLKYATDWIKAVECQMLNLEGAFSWFKPAAVSRYTDGEGDQAVSWEGLGYKTILDILLKNFPNKTGYNIDDKISLNKTVSKIILNEDSVQVKTTDGTEYVAEHLIFTPSLGVLKHDHMNMFEPGLSRKKVDAIENLGFDGVMKVILEFSNEWWGSKENFIFVWTDEERKNLRHDIPYGPMTDNDHWLSWFHLIGIAPNNKNILIGWIVGPMVPEVEKLTEEEIKNGSYHVLKMFLGNEFNVTEPIKAIHSKWCSNPHVRGAYSYEAVNLAKMNMTSARTDLLEPINSKDGIPRILFAGEATNPTRYATVDGAVGSGFREADRLNTILKK